MNLKNTIFILIIALFLLQMIVMKQDTDLSSLKKVESTKTSMKYSVALSTFPLFDIAKNIVGKKLDIFMILPVGVDAHSYEPNPKQVIKLYKSALVIYSGASLEPWISRFKFKNKIIDMSSNVDLIELEDKSHHHENHAESCSHDKIDPHYWLSISNMIKSTNIITDAFINLDPKNKVYYLKNKLTYIEMLETLDNLYKSTLAVCNKNEILTNHNAFSYLAKKYNFQIHSLSSLTPESQASAKNMIHLLDEIKEHNISTIFYESFASSKAIKSIAYEAGVKIEVLQPLANITADEQELNLSYEDIMKLNLFKLAKAMDCQ